MSDYVEHPDTKRFKEVFDDFMTEREAHAVTKTTSAELLDALKRLVASVGCGCCAKATFEADYQHAAGVIEKASP